jgi:hypothetical protein
MLLLDPTWAAQEGGLLRVLLLWVVHLWEEAVLQWVEALLCLTHLREAYLMASAMVVVPLLTLQYLTMPFPTLRDLLPPTTSLKMHRLSKDHLILLPWSTTLLISSSLPGAKIEAQDLLVRLSESLWLISTLNFLKMT